MPAGTVHEGRFSEVPNVEATGMDRRAFGEFIGPNGELASYAFGWTTAGSPREGRITVGIGVGNPGGATFDAAVFISDGTLGYALVDEPFERVPQGGPDLSAEAGRAPEVLPFIWWVADQVQQQDRRAWWMYHWVAGTQVIQIPQGFERTEPILLVANDADDHLWQLVGTANAEGTTGKIAHLSHAIAEDPTQIDVLDLEPGNLATRIDAGGAWTRSAVEGDS